MWEGKWNIKGRTDVGEKLAFSEKVWTVKEEMRSIAYSRINVPSTLRDKWNEWARRRLWMNRRR
jgi:hypothetical protein